MVQNQCYQNHFFSNQAKQTGLGLVSLYNFGASKLNQGDWLAK